MVLFFGLVFFSLLPLKNFLRTPLSREFSCEYTNFLSVLV